MSELDKLALDARKLADGLANDVALCANREEHVRLTARLNEAQHLFLSLDALIAQNTAT
jgi:hypothetical protein